MPSEAPGNRTIQQHVADGTTTVWEFSFAGGYISREHVYVYVYDDGSLTGGTPVPFTFIGDSTLAIEPAVAAGKIIRIFRQTPTDAPLVDFSDGSVINEETLDTNAKQAVFLSAEIRDMLGEVPELSALRDAIDALAFARDRENHTGVQEITTVTGLAVALASLQGQIDALDVAVADLGGIEAIVEQLSATTPRYMVEEDLQPLAINGTILSDDSFPLDITEELDAEYRAPNLPVAARDLAEVIIQPPQDSGRLGRAASYPFVMIGDAETRLVPVDIRARLLGSSICPPLFTPLVRNGDGALTFRFNGEKPLYTVLRGQLDYLCRVGGVVDNGMASHLLSLFSPDAPTLEGGNLGRRAIANHLGFFQDGRRLDNALAVGDECWPLTDDIIDASVANSWTVLYDSGVDGVDEGHFAAGSTDEILLTTEPGSRTTKWIDTDPWDMQERSVFLSIGTGTSTRKRLQVKFADDSIMYVPAMSRSTAPGGAHAIYRIPKDAVQFRVNYRGPGDDADGLVCKVMPPSASADNDPGKGYWSPVSFAVCREVVFYPGCTYAFTIGSSVYSSGATVRDYGFRLRSGGIHFLFDASEYRARRAKTLYTEDC